MGRKVRVDRSDSPDPEPRDEVADQTKPPRSHVTSLRDHHLRVAAAVSILRLYHALAPNRFKRFCGLSVFIPRGVFDPTVSVSTSLMISALRTLQRVLPRGKAIDYGCGSGAIGIYIAKYMGFEEVHLLDVDTLALATARINAFINGVLDKVRIVSSPLYNDYDLAVSNPPYLPLDPQIDIDRCWCGGSTLETYRSIVRSCIKSLRRGGVLLISFSSLTYGAPRVLKSLCASYTIVRSARTPFDTIYVAACVKGST